MLLDARLPGVSGVEFQEQTARRRYGFPVIFMTAHGDMPMVRKVMKAGAIEFLIKPFQKEELLHAVEQAFDLIAHVVKRKPSSIRSARASNL